MQVLEMFQTAVKPPLNIVAKSINNTQLWMLLMIEARSDAVNSNIA